MCTIAVAFRANEAYPLVVASNRDEFYDRPSAPADFWDGTSGMLAGRDLRGGGTWFGVTTTGRFAALTNIRHGFDHRDAAPSRGEIVADYLRSSASPMEFALDFAPNADQYNGFNALLGDVHDLVYLNNRDGKPRRLEPGIYALSNAELGADWPKVRRAAQFMEEALRGEVLDPEDLFTLLSDAEQSEDHLLPDTGVGAPWERVLSPIFIRTEAYGTCASTVYVIDAAGHARFLERRAVPVDSEDAAERRYEFQIIPPPD